MVGESGGMEEGIAAKENIPFFGVLTAKWQRHIPIIRQLPVFIKIPLGVLQALLFFLYKRPKAVVGFGSFASFSAVMAAFLLRIPYYLHEANAFPGLVTRLFAARAAMVMTPHSSLGEHLKGRRPLVTLPLPVREKQVSREEARAQLGIPQEALVTMVMGGSQGSLVLNQTVPEAYAALTDRSGLHVLHSSGRGKDKALKRHLEERLEIEGIANTYQVAEFLDASLAWAAADLAICRSGTGTISEAAFAGVPLVMIPLAISAENHQYYNAMSVCQAGGGYIVEEHDLSAESLSQAWTLLLGKGRRDEAAKAMQGFNPQGAAEKMAGLLEDDIDRGRLASRLIHRATRPSRATSRLVEAKNKAS